MRLHIVRDDSYRRVSSIDWAFFILSIVLRIAQRLETQPCHRTELRMRRISSPRYRPVHLYFRRLLVGTSLRFEGLAGQVCGVDRRAKRSRQ